MRSELVYAAGLRIENRFLLATAAMGAVHKLHISSMRTEDTINKVFVEVAHSDKFVAKLPEVVPPPAIEMLLITPAA
jgi:hypothetical protein